MPFHAGGSPPAADATLALSGDAGDLDVDESCKASLSLLRTVITMAV